MRCLALVSAIVLILVSVAPARAARPVNCSRLHPRAELRCAKAQLAWAKRGGPHHSAAYWRWRERVARRWIRQAKRRLAVPSPGSPYSPDPRSARYWTYRFFGRGWEARLMLCVAWTESRDELSPPVNGSSWGPWQILVSPTIHSWVNTYRVTHSWRYAAAVAWRISDHGTYFAPWHPDCGA